jgi:hypothetical protein
MESLFSFPVGLFHPLQHAGLSRRTPYGRRHGNRRRSRVLFRSGSAAANCMAGALIDACGLATLTPEEETESPGEVRSQRRLCLPSVDE